MVLTRRKTEGPPINRNHLPPMTEEEVQGLIERTSHYWKMRRLAEAAIKGRMDAQLDAIREQTNKPEKVAPKRQTYKSDNTLA